VTSGNQVENARDINPQRLLYNGRQFRVCGSKRSNCANEKIILDADQVDCAAVHSGKHVYVKFPEGWGHFNYILQ
jgi:hypothetical protein